MLTEASTAERCFSLMFGALSLREFCRVNLEWNLQCFCIAQRWVTCELCVFFAHESLPCRPGHACVKTLSSSHRLNACSVNASQFIIYTHSDYLHVNSVTPLTIHWKPLTHWKIRFTENIQNDAKNPTLVAEHWRSSVE